MIKSIFTLVILTMLFSACNNSTQTKATTSDAAAVDSSGNGWRFGVALWTFHTMNFPESLAKVDSAGVDYIEPNTFHSAGPELKDSMLGQLSYDGIEKVKAMISGRGLKTESIYVNGDTTLASWVRQFELAKQFGVKFITTEPPVSMWNTVDSLAGVYGIKVAIHEHWKGVSAYWHPDSVLAAIKDHPNFGACADLGHWPKSGIEPLEAVKKLSGHIIGVHFKDIAAFNNPALKDVVAGKGIVNFPGILKELKTQQFNGNIYIERDSTEPAGNLPSVIETVNYYNGLMQKLQ
ncbi:MAG: sugar phosphate isomerase/epimerase [Bacteroidota bacterium]